MQATRHPGPAIVVTLAAGERLGAFAGPCAFAVPEDPANQDYADLVASGAAIVDVAPVITEADFGAAIQAHLDATARARGYDGALSITTYIGSSIPQWAAEAAAFFAWRDQVWAYAYAELAKVRAGQMAAPTPAELVEKLPAIDWPA